MTNDSAGQLWAPALEANPSEAHTRPTPRARLKAVRTERGWASAGSAAHDLLLAGLSGERQVLRTTFLEDNGARSGGRVALLLAPPLEQPPRSEGARLHTNDGKRARLEEKERERGRVVPHSAPAGRENVPAERDERALERPWELAGQLDREVEPVRRGEVA